MNNNEYTLPRLVCGGMQLEREVFPSGKGGIWEWQEKTRQPTGNKKAITAKLNLEEKSDPSHSVAFSLDNSLKDRFPFFPEHKSDLGKAEKTYGIRGGLKPLENIGAICDIIVLSQKENALRAFAIEVKSSPADNPQSNIQIKNGVFFCEWLHRLLNEHCKMPAMLEIVRITSLAGGKVPGKLASNPANIEPKPLHKTKTLQYNSNVKTIPLEEAYGFCQRYKFLIKKDVSVT